MNPVLAPIQIFDVQFDDIADGIVEHEKTGCLFNRVIW